MAFLLTHGTKAAFLEAERVWASTSDLRQDPKSGMVRVGKSAQAAAFPVNIGGDCRWTWQ